MESKYTADEYKKLAEYAKENVLASIINHVFSKKNVYFAKEIETILSSNDFVSDRTKKMTEYMYSLPFEDIPLLINERDSFLEPILKWRLAVGR